MRQTITYGAAAFLMALVVLSCNKEKPKPVCDGSKPTYDGNIKALVSSSCSGGSCHGAGSTNGDWSTYATLKPVLDNGQFANRVLTVQDMPKGKNLSQEQLNMLQCWVENGYPEK